jgi:hypothetical protein
VCFRSWPRPLVFLASAVRVERGLAVTFNYPPSLISLVGDNLVSNDQGSSPTMNPAIGIGTGEQILLAEILWRCDSILQTLSVCSSDSEAVGDGAWCAIGGLGGNNDASVLGGAMGADSGGDALTATGGDAMAVISSGGAMGGELDVHSGDWTETSSKAVGREQEPGLGF